MLVLTSSVCATFASKQEGDYKGLPLILNNHNRTKRRKRVKKQEE